MQSLSKTDNNAKQLFDIFLQAVQSSIVRTIARDSRFIVRSRKMDPFILLRAFVEVMGTDKELAHRASMRDMCRYVLKRNRSS